MYISSLFLIQIFSVIINGKFRNDYIYQPLVDGWLKYHRVPDTWANARLRCKYEGSVLASPVTNELRTLMMALSKHHVLATFTGFSAAYSQGDVLSVEGVSLETVPVSWAPREPNNRNNTEQCFVLFYNGTMADVDCERPRPYICYRRNTGDMPAVGECGTIDPEYVFEPKTGSCYKFHRYILSWSEASMVCTAEGGYLAIVNSQTEAEALKTVVQKETARDLLIPESNSNVAFIGFRAWTARGTWMTIHGQTLEEAGYRDWYHARGPYHTDDGVYYCGGIFRHVIRLVDISCDNPWPFLCEKAPQSLQENDTRTSNEIAPIG